MPDAPHPATDEDPPGWWMRLVARMVANARSHPYLTALAGFWCFGYTMMVPQLLGSGYLPYLSERMGGAPETLIVAFAGLLVMVLLFAFIVPWGLWMMVCGALAAADEDDGDDA